MRKKDDLPLDMDEYVPHGRGPLSSEVLRRIRVKKLGEIGGYRVYAVDGALVRSVHVEFTTGGSAGRYSYIPEGEVWVEHVLEPADLAASLLHELVECDLMIKRGLDYDAAHEEANAIETYLRAQMVWRPGPGISLEKAVDVTRRWYGRWAEGQRARART